MSDSALLLIPKHKPIRARLRDEGPLEVWIVSGRVDCAPGAQALADALVKVLGARGRSMMDVALVHEKRGDRPFVLITLQARHERGQEAV